MNYINIKFILKIDRTAKIKISLILDLISINLTELFNLEVIKIKAEIYFGHAINFY